MSVATLASEVRLMCRCYPQSIHQLFARTSSGKVEQRDAREVEVLAAALDEVLGELHGYS